MSLKIVSFFSGAGGLDLGFKKAGFDIIYANEFDKDIWDTYRLNHPETILDTRSITQIDEDEIPDCDGIIGGPPCQSWSEAGSKRGINDQRGQLFFDFIRILKAKKPSFFLAENVSGMLASRHSDALNNIKETFLDAGYDLYFKLLNSAEFGIAQDRKRVIFIGFRSDLKIDYSFPEPTNEVKTLKDIIQDLEESVVPALNKSKPNPDVILPNHEYMTGGFSSMYMSRNRVRTWDEPSFTIQAGGRHAPIHPSAPRMIKLDTDQFIFAPNSEYRRLSVRECARIQGFPDDFIFKYSDVNHGYKMIGNAVNVEFANILATSILKHLPNTQIKDSKKPMSSTIKAFNTLCDTVIEEFNENYNVNNRVNQVGDALEKFIKDLYANTFNETDFLPGHQKVFSYLGNKNNPPDVILRNSDAIEIKKVETTGGDIALNSSFPKDFLYKDDPLITTACKNCEQNNPWYKKDMLYVVGVVNNKLLRGLWFVYGDCYAADRDIYRRIKDTVTTGISTLDLDLLPTNEIAKINKVDPLGITNLRVRGMWSIQHPSKAFSRLQLNTTSPFFAHLIVSKKKFDSFNDEDINTLYSIAEKQESVSIKNCEIQDPNNPANNIEAVVVSLNK